ncbi:MAG: hypothetical protein CUN55_00535 [Phototrophicales bacterium]|nr:MAG: hypothetical protein CUN55_00535 [Phototrophicales bacterium]
MTIPAQSGVFGFAIQPAKVGRTGTFNPGSLTWYKARAPRVSLGTIQDLRPFPLEVGGRNVSTGAFKQGVFFGGEVDIIPRLENNIGWLLKAAMGTASTVTGVDGDNVSVTGLNTHIFRFDPTNSFNLPWFAVRCKTPGTTSSQDWGETGFDCRMSMLRFMVPNQGKVLMRAQLFGRDVVLEEQPSFTFANANFEDNTSTPDAGNGYIKIDGTEYPFLSATLDFENSLTRPDTETIIGDFRPDDFVPLSRSLTIDLVYKYENPDLYQQILTGSAAGTTWSSNPFITNTGANHAFEAVFSAPKAVPGASPTRNYTIRVRADKVAWQVAGPTELNAGGFITQRFTGIVLDPAANQEYATIVLENDHSAY